MRIEWMNTVVGVGAGVVDSSLEVYDANKGKAAPFKTVTDWTRVGLTALGYLGQMFNMQSRFAEPLAQSEVTLLTKSVYNAVMSKSSNPVVVRGRPSAGGAPVPTGITRGRVGWRPLPVGV